jgi:hypothetical protein
MAELFINRLGISIVVALGVEKNTKARREPRTSTQAKELIKRAWC